MKKAINNKIYNTETAKIIYAVESDEVRGEFCYYKESLYQKKTGEYFLACSGGAFNKIIPLDYEQAMQWAEDNMSDDEYIAVFREPSEDVTVRVVSDISETLKAKLDETARNENKSVSAVIKTIISDYYK